MTSTRVISITRLLNDQQLKKVPHELQATRWTITIENSFKESSKCHEEFVKTGSFSWKFTFMYGVNPKCIVDFSSAAMQVFTHASIGNPDDPVPCYSDS